MNFRCLSVGLVGLVMGTLFARAEGGGFEVRSGEVVEGGVMSKEQEFDGFDGVGKNVSPGLRWVNVPEGTKSFAVTVYDPDAPTGSGWWHFVMVNVPATVREVGAGVLNDERKLPVGVQLVRNDYGMSLYGGPCPPKGDKAHRYEFRVYALKVEKLDLPKDASAALAGFMIRANALGCAKLTALYGR